MNALWKTNPKISMMLIWCMAKILGGELVSVAKCPEWWKYLVAKILGGELLSVANCPQWRNWLSGELSSVAKLTKWWMVPWWLVFVVKRLVVKHHGISVQKQLKMSSNQQSTPKTVQFSWLELILYWSSDLP